MSSQQPCGGKHVAHSVPELGVGRQGRRSPWDHDQVYATRQLQPVPAHGFPQAPPQAIPRHRPAESATDRNAEANGVQPVGIGVKDNQRAGAAGAVPIDAAKILIPREATDCVSRSHRPYPETVSRCLPFDRRRCNVRRPPAVRMRARNPWTRLRGRFFG